MILSSFLLIYYSTDLISNCFSGYYLAEEFNLTNENVLQIPYNISREVADNVIKESVKVVKNGKEIYPIDWVSEIRDNMVFSSANKCLSVPVKVLPNAPVFRFSDTSLTAS